MAGTAHRLRFRSPFRHYIPIFQHRANVRGLFPKDPGSSAQSGYTEPDEFRNRAVWVDGCIPGRDLGLSVGNYHVDVLVDDAGWNVRWVLDGNTDELVVDSQRYQETLRVA